MHEESWRATESWLCEKPEEATGEGAAAAPVGGPRLKRSCREVEAWHHEESPGDAIGESAAHFGDAITMG